MADPQEQPPHSDAPAAAIPSADLLAWYSAERTANMRDAVRIEEVRQTALSQGRLDDMDRDIELAQALLRGKDKVLTGFAAFLMSQGITVENVTKQPKKQG